jgi:TetR/AcrR family transcriptional regulator
MFESVDEGAGVDRELSPRDAILEATMSAIAENNIDGTTLRGIADRAGMSQGNLHYYFPSKAELFLALLDRMLETFKEERQCALKDLDGSAADRLACFLDQKAEIITQRRYLMDTYYNFWVQGTHDAGVRDKLRSMYANWRTEIKAIVDEGVAQGEFDPASASIIPALMVSMMEGATVQYLVDNEAFDLQRLFSTGHEVILGMLGAG